ncbi:hypothetical protein CesoFtcFv8_026202 [Champsocephalus esox]|uniref:Uncharacterized protein n=1 Tax=Champsocephalus esox TaxID=159716 RepID=A0AAN8B1V0_9TELE|nr:hypothetical protein CesoFtcFv8_026202 [Champsocephalus esox]
MSYVCVAVPAAAHSLRLSAGCAALWRGGLSNCHQILHQAPHQCKEFVHFLRIFYSMSKQLSAGSGREFKWNTSAHAVYKYSKVLRSHRTSSAAAKDDWTRQ